MSHFIQAYLHRSGVPVCTCTTWACYTGILTTQRAGAFSVSVNYRESSGVNMQGAGLRLDVPTLRRILGGCLRRRWTVGGLVRSVAMTGRDFDHAVGMLSTQPLLSSCYLIVAGVQPGQGVRRIDRGGERERGRGEKGAKGWGEGERGRGGLFGIMRVLVWIMSQRMSFQCGCPHWILESSP
jgi:hypothetical protein